MPKIEGVVQWSANTLKKVSLSTHKRDVIHLQGDGESYKVEILWQLPPNPFPFLAELDA